MDFFSIGVRSLGIVIVGELGNECARASRDPSDRGVGKSLDVLLVKVDRIHVRKDTENWATA